jgi:signal transduction histidine kinase
MQPIGNRKLGLLALLVSVVSGAPVSAGAPDRLDSYTPLSWTEREGLPAAEIRDIAQDRNGYLWMGTGAGLVRFDGVRFLHWDALGGPPLPSGSINFLSASRDGSLWVGFVNIPGLFHVHDRQVTTYREQDGLPGAVIGALLEDRDGVIWVGGTRGVSRFRDGRWERLGTMHGLGELSIDTMYQSRNGDLWLGTSAGVFRRAGGSDLFQRLSTIPDFRGFIEGADGRMWATGRLTLLGSPDRDRPSDPDAARGIWNSALGWRILADSEGNLWIATLGQGLIRVSGRERRIIRHFQGRNDLTSDVVLSLFQDREGNIWAGTQRGLERFSETVVTSVDAATAGITGLITSVAAGADGSIWMGASDGLHQLVESDWRRYEQRDGLPSVMVEGLNDDHAGSLWVATDRGIARFAGGRFERVHGTDVTRRVRALATDRHGTTWLADRNRGLFQWRDGRLEAVSGLPGSEATLPMSVYTDRAGHLWAGFADGSLITDQDGRLAAYSDQEGLAGGITAVHEDRNGTVWIGTLNGLRRFDHGRFAAVAGGDQVFRGTVETIIDDDEGYLWIGVRAGLVRVDPRELQMPTGESHSVKYTLYDTSDGLLGDVLQARAARTPDGRLWFATNNGLAVVDPRRLSKRRLPPPITIEGVNADQRQFDPIAHLSLPALTSNLRIDYAALSFAAPARVRFRYRLEGFDRDWIDAGGRRQAFYTNLPPRSYRFHVVAANDGVWNDSGAAWEFSIRPKFYQTNSFYAALIVALMLAAWAAWRVRVGQERRRFSFVLAERARIAREIHDTLLQSLVGVAVQFKTLAMELESSPSAASDHLTKLRRQIETYIREARRSIWDLRSPTLEGTDLGSALRHVAERMINGIPLRFDFHVTGTPRVCPPRIEEQLLKIGQEAISNVVRHANARALGVELAYGDSEVVLRIADDGRGFEPDGGAGSQVHWGLTIMSERAQMIGARFDLASHPGRGTEIEVVVPVLAGAGAAKRDRLPDWSTDAPLSAADRRPNA